jgi:hypothetical protein
MRRAQGGQGAPDDKSEHHREFMDWEGERLTIALNKIMLKRLL